MRNNKSVYLLLLCGLIMLTSSGCASIIVGGEETISVTSNPPEASFTIKDQTGAPVTSGVTPSNVTLKKGSGWFAAADYMITMSKTGYKDATMPVPQGVDVLWYGAGNLVFGGLIGWLIVDPMTGAMWDLKDVNMSLEPVGSSMVLPDYDSLRAIPAERYSQTWRHRMVRNN